MKSLNPFRYLLLIGFSFACACTIVQLEKDDKSISIINSSFLQIVDTLAYRYHSLRPSANSPTFKSTEMLKIAMYSKLTNIYEWKTEISSSLNQLKDSSEYIDFSRIFDINSTDTLEKLIDIAEIKETGRYKIIGVISKDARKFQGVIGQIYFSKAIYNDRIDKALLVATIRDNVKSGIVKLFFLNKVNNKWLVIKENILEIW